MLGWTPSGSAVGSVTCARDHPHGPGAPTTSWFDLGAARRSAVNNHSSPSKSPPGYLTPPASVVGRESTSRNPPDWLVPVRLASANACLWRVPSSVRSAAVGWAPRRHCCSDQPLAAVDRSRRWRLLKWLRHEILTQKFAALFVSHAWDEIESFCDHALILADGRLHE